MKLTGKQYWQLFITTFSLSAFTFGGGYVIVPLMKKKFVDKLKWIDEEEMLNMVAIAQSSPGAIAINTSIMVGYRMAGIIGALIAVIGTVLPPLIILTVISMFYQSFKENKLINAALKGMEAGVAAVVIDVVFGMTMKIIKEKRQLSVIMMVGAFAATFFFRVNAVFIILISGFIGAVVVIRRERIEKRGAGK